MNWLKTMLDSLAMAACFNLFAAAVALYNPRLMFPSCPPAIIKAAPNPPTKTEIRFYLLWIVFGELVPLVAWGAFSMTMGGEAGFWQMALAGHIQWMIVNFADLFFLDFWLIQKKAKARFVIAGTEGRRGYKAGEWMRRYALPEHLLQWPLLLCPIMAAAQGALALLFQKILQCGLLTRQRRFLARRAARPR